MTLYRPFPASIVDLDRKVSRAIQRGKGLTLSAEQLDVLTQIGILKSLAEAKAEILKEVETTVNTTAFLKEKVKHICTIKGVGLLTEVTVIAETNGFHLIKNKKV